ncbi:hypothetical protein ACGFNP_25580 [Nonomuraea sp. NPDC049269]|uniref:hypothetical protein n=1 Tax=Nonomuraea sp. NPDC049269 TaxID=3364349 RepID=UPI003712820E
MNPEIAERFARETANHEMTVRHDDGLYRHLQFREPNSFNWFELITVPRALIYRSSGTSHVFSREDDMFAFFRGPVGRINPGYWAEKLTSGRDGIKKYDQELFEQQVRDHVAQAIQDRIAPRGISRAIRELLENGDITYEEGARRELEDFEYGAKYQVSCTCDAKDEFAELHDAEMWGWRHINEANAQVRHRTTHKRVDGFRFYDLWEWEFKDYDWWFLWALHGIVWGISQYDSKRAELVAAGAVAG